MSGGVFVLIPTGCDSSLTYLPNYENSYFPLLSVIGSKVGARTGEGRNDVGILLHQFENRRCDTLLMLASGAAAEEIDSAQYGDLAGRHAARGGLGKGLLQGIWRQYRCGAEFARRWNGYSHDAWKRSPFYGSDRWPDSSPRLKTALISRSSASPCIPCRRCCG